MIKNNAKNIFKTHQEYIRFMKKIKKINSESEIKAEKERERIRLKQRLEVKRRCN
jgi:hypothetical protein